MADRVVTRTVLKVVCFPLDIVLCVMHVVAQISRIKHQRRILSERMIVCQVFARKCLLLFYRTLRGWDPGRFRPLRSLINCSRSLDFGRPSVQKRESNLKAANLKSTLDKMFRSISCCSSTLKTGRASLSYYTIIKYIVLWIPIDSLLRIQEIQKTRSTWNGNLTSICSVQDYKIYVHLLQNVWFVRVL